MRCSDWFCERQFCSGASAASVDGQEFVRYLEDVFEKLKTTNKQPQGMKLLQNDAKPKMFGFISRVTSET